MHEVRGRLRFCVPGCCVDLMAPTVAQQVTYTESISVRYDGLADEDYVAGLCGLAGVHRSYDWTANE